MICSITNVIVTGVPAAIRAMRNPQASWAKSDSSYVCHEGGYLVGAKDAALSRKLCAAGGSHCKHLRFIHVSATLRLPRYVWTEWDTYKVGTTRLSCSTMNLTDSSGKIKEFTAEDFAKGDIDKYVLSALNDRLAGLSAGATTLVDLKRALPEGFLQTAAVDFSYQTALAMCRDRKAHRLAEWREELVPWLTQLPYFSALTGFSSGVASSKQTVDK